MKKRYILTMLFTLPILLAGCDSLGHVHDWTSFYDNGDGTHSRMCLKDSSHIETEVHKFNESILKEATDNSPGEVLKKCSGCGYEETVHIPPTGSHVYNQEIAENKYLYEKCSEYSSIFYKSSQDGAYGDPNYLFEKNSLPEGYSSIEYIQGNGTEFIDTGIEKTSTTSVLYNKCKGKNGRLPYNYQEVEYIEFTGKQFIKTSIYQAATWDFDLQWAEVSSRQLMGYSGKDCQYFGVNEGKYAIYSISNSEIGNRDKVRFSTENFNHGLYINDFKVLDAGMTSESPDATFTVGRLGSTFNCEFKLYSLTCHKNNEIIGEFIPCYNIETNEIGLFDLYKFEFLNNLGSEPLIKGDDVTQKTRLPSDYQELQYIESSGNQIIDTGYADNLSLTIDAKFEVLTANSNYLYGSKQNLESYLNNGLYSRGEETPVVLEYNWKTVDGIFAGLGIIELNQSISDDEFIVTMNGKSAKVPLSKVAPEENLQLFGCFNPKGENRPYGSGLRCYSFIMKDNNITVREYVPAERKADGQIGLYDLIENSFYFDEGFIPGPIVEDKSLPTEYQEVEYLEAVGNAGSYIKTDYFPNQDLSISTEFEVTSFDDAKSMIYSSAGEGWGDNSFECYCWNNQLQINYAGTNKFFPCDNKRISINSNANFYQVKSTNVMTEEYEYKSCTSPNEFVLFGLHRNSGVSCCSENIKIYYFKVNGVNNSPIFDLVPCYRKSDNKPGFYDLFNNYFLENSGTGEFMVGPDINGTATRSKNAQRLSEVENENIKIGFNYVADESFYYFGRIYDAVVNDNGKTVQKLIPALRNSDSAIGMYDLIGGKFYEQTGEFKNNGVVGHKLDDGVIIKEPTFEEDGKICYTCSICGSKIYKVIPRLSYKVSFTYDEGIKELRIHSDNDPSHYEVKDFAYTRNPGSFNFSTSNAAVWFEIVFNEGYEFNELTGPKGMFAHLTNENMHLLALIQGDIDVNITSKKIV